MNTIFVLLIAKNLILVYMNDILIHTLTKKQLHKMTKEVLKILQKYNLCLKPEKYEFTKKQLSYLGYIISPNQVQMDLIKLKEIANQPTPTTVKETRKFLRFCHKLHSVISPSNIRRFPRSQSQLKALKKTFRSMPVTS